MLLVPLAALAWAMPASPVRLWLAEAGLLHWRLAETRYWFGDAGNELDVIAQVGARAAAGSRWAVRQLVEASPHLSDGGFGMQMAGALGRATMAHPQTVLEEMVRATPRIRRHALFLLCYVEESHGWCRLHPRLEAGARGDPRLLRLIDEDAAREAWNVTNAE
jgi:hypothetical protein